MWAGRRRTTGGSWRRCSNGTAPGSPGATCRSASARGRRSTSASIAGRRPGSGSACSPRCAPTRTTSTPSIVRAHQHSAGAHKGGVGDEAIGRSRAGLSTKIHALIDALGNPTAFHLSGGQAHDLAGADALLAGIVAPTRSADRSYDAEARVLRPLREADKVAVIPSKRGRTVRRDGDRDLHAARHLAEHFFCRLKQSRGSATRYDRTRRNFPAGVHAAATAILLNCGRALTLRPVGTAPAAVMPADRSPPRRRSRTKPG